MKKLFALILAVMMVTTLSITAFATNTTGGNADITTSIQPTYTVDIPADINVNFNATKTAFGKISVSAAQIHPNKCISVSVTFDGKLKNSLDATKVIPYNIKDGNGVDFTSAKYLAKGDQTELYIHITQDDWNAAYAGEYSDTVTFNVSYQDK